MKISKLRRLAARGLTRGRLEALADEVGRALQTGHGSTDSETRLALMEHAVRQVPYYESYANHNFEDLPVIEKLDIRADLTSFLSRDVELKNLASASTSGSTGTPFTAYFDTEKVLRHRASLVGTYQFMGADPFGPFVFGRAWSKLGPKQRLLLAAKGSLPYSGVHQDPKQIEDVVNWINRRSGVTLVGYSSYTEELLRNIIDKGLEVKPGAVDAVIGGSEPASDYLDYASRELFGIRSKMRYSSNELGIIAVTREDPSIYHVDTQSYYVEILEEESDRPALPGASGRIVVTDLHNRAMPFVRYDTGDLGQFFVDSEGTVHPNRLVNIKGRRLDVLLAGTVDNPKKLHSLQIFRGVTSEISEIHQFQLRQHALGRFTWILDAERSSSVESRLRKALAQVVGPVEECNFVYVDEVPTMASGKRRFFVNEIFSEEQT